MISSSRVALRRDLRGSLCARVPASWETAWPDCPLFFLVLACLALSGCGATAFPCRVASATLKIVPTVGHPVAAPFDACADTID